MIQVFAKVNPVVNGQIKTGYMTPVTKPMAERDDVAILRAMRMFEAYYQVHDYIVKDHAAGTTENHVVMV